jgi:hypothetical protein
VSADGAPGRRLAIVASVVVLATVVAAVVVTGSPSAQRQAKLDVRRVQDLVRVVAAIDAQVKETGVLPASLPTLAEKPGAGLAIVDPVTAKPYEFQKTGPRSYRLCADFSTDTSVTPPSTRNWSGKNDWLHGSGRQCFARTVGDSD